MHPYQVIAEKYREQIRDGELTPGQRLPPITELTEEHGVARATIRNALTWLQAEGYVTTTQRGTFVAEVPTAGPSGRDRLMRVYRTGSILAKGETKLVTSAGLAAPPLYVSELFDLDPGKKVVRREYVTGQGSFRTGLHVDWYPPHLADEVPDLLRTEPRRGDDLMVQLAETLGRRVKFGRDAFHGREASEREARLLSIPVGSAVGAGAHEWLDDDGLIVYGEWVLPRRFTIGFEYTLETE
ncbi:GntR family transcriptional regulator [Streptomyces katsurahamanus]|uniref:GntR family transcriptional regulator n=1 Tax=Streptomyces katsurahamanus TaxID=2577098 RepID=A0ABW9NNM3_9ACTN|nr:GntR family transcriptional regulator [Streptomyces katsurahamanus]MQS34766.1 GntR family transcriptional regulator [Streptomyces katsurahamanus]